MIERRGSDQHFRRHQGAEHLAILVLEKIRMTGAFDSVNVVSSRLAYLQVTRDPADDLTDAFDARLQAAREALAPILMEPSDITLA